VTTSRRWLGISGQHWLKESDTPHIPRFVGAAGSVILVGGVAATVTGVAALVGSSDAAAGVALVGALAVAMATLPAAAGYKRLPSPSRGINWRLPHRSDIVLAVAFGVVTGALAGSGGLPGAKAGIRGVVGAGTVAMVITLIYAWSSLQKGAPLDTRSAASPSTVLARDRDAAIFVGAVRWSGAAIVAGTIAMLRLGVVNGVVTGIAVWAMCAVWIGLLRDPWPSYEIARIWLALRHRLPWRLMGFLADAHRRGVIRQAGAVYQFRHIELQQRLATRPLNSRT